MRTYNTSRSVTRFLCAALCLSLPGAAFGQRSMPIFGTWIETVANGGGIVTEITPTTIISRPRTAGGVYGKIITTGPTGYRALGNNPRLGQAYAIEPYGPDNKPQPGITAYLHDPDNLLLDFAGMGMHHLTRLVPGS